ncbi:hypothetical protein PENDEC_c003G06720 [Penicillium decumbens]|uniref:Uncharacterized protein n=1 Tax=Penicillium decumbens TaxID=69771 RepID=A0A1V6PJY7_PENDC|nr:hypothetical protein PENDEC_c003G06720 [Penicillium decumbens]
MASAASANTPKGNKGKRPREENADEEEPAQKKPRGPPAKPEKKMTEEESRKEDEAIERAAAKHQRALERLRARQQEKRVAKEPPTKDPEVLQDAPSIQNQTQTQEKEKGAVNPEKDDDLNLFASDGDV